MKESRSLAFSALSPIVWIVVLIALGAPAAAADNQSRIANIDDSLRVKLAHSTHPFMQSATDLGRIDPNVRMERMLLILGPSDEVQPSLRSFLDTLHDKTSANYHQWLTPEKFGERFGPSQGDVAKVVAWLQKQGFDGVKAARGRGHIEFSGNTQLVEHAFQTEMHRFQLGSQTHLANISDISIPQ